MKTNKIFGKRSDLKVGDLVWWTDLDNIHHKNYGVIKEFELVSKGGRFVWMAIVFQVEKMKYHTFLTSILHKEDKQDKLDIRANTYAM